MAKADHSHYPDPDDMFADTRMTFGEHIEDLRAHLLRAIYGFVIGLIVALIFLGRPVLTFIEKPVKDQLRAYWERFQHERLTEIRAALTEDKPIDGKRIIIPTIAIDLPKLRERLGLPEIAEPPVNLVPAFVDTFKLLGVGELVEKQYLAHPRWFEVQLDPQQFARWISEFNQVLAPKSLTTLSVQEGFVVYVKVAMLTGLVITSPWVFYQIWAFIAAGLYPHEKRYVNVYLPFSLALFLGGIFVCEFFVMPKAIAALLWFNEILGLQPDLRLNEWLGFAIMMPLVFGISFQTPLVMLFLERIGLFDIETYRSKRRISWFLMAVFAAVITPSTDPVSMMFLWVPMGLLYELGVFLCTLSPRSPGWDVEVPESEELVEV